MAQGCALGALLTLIAAPAGLAEAIAGCQPLQEQRQALAREAMQAEIALAGRYRQQLCPELHRRAELANANSQVFAPINYAALLECRQAAERQLEQENPLLYRNRAGFTFYSAAGHAAARLADQQLERLQRQGCRP
ncbi:MAG: hypothetical protein ACO3FA_06120 [Vulcanococcus sp.]